MIGALTVLLLFQLAGEFIAQAFGLPVPGPVLGLLFLFLALLLRGSVAEPLRRTSLGILEHLSVLFVPAGAGVILHAHRIGAEWLPILLALVLSTLIGLAVTALTLRALGRANRQGER